MTQGLRVLGELPDGAVRRIRAAWPEVRVRHDGPLQSGDAVLAWDYDPEPLLALLAGRVPVRWVHTRATGVDPRMPAAVGRNGAIFTCGRGGHGAAVAEHVLAMVLAHLRRLPELLRRQARREWDAAFTVTELAGRCVGVMGAGDLGGSAARLLRAFGVRLRVLRRSPQQGDQTYGPADLHRFLDGLEVLVVALPLTGDTRGLLSAAELERVARGCLLVNVGRGQVVDQDAMIAKLRTGRLGGAALDVFAEEPLPADSVLWHEPGVIVSPHCADATAGADARLLESYLSHVARFRAGQPLTAVVRPELGY